MYIVTVQLYPKGNNSMEMRPFLHVLHSKHVYTFFLCIFFRNVQDTTCKLKANLLDEFKKVLFEQYIGNSLH